MRAELFYELKANGTEAITIEHVKDIITRIGKPEEMAGESDETGNDSQKTSGHRYDSFLNNFRADAQVDHFFKHEGLSMSDININLQYVLGDGPLHYYPLAGLALVGHSTNAFGFLEEMKAGFNVGAGAELPIGEKFKFFVEAKYQIVSDWGRFIPTVGVMFAL